MHHGIDRTFSMQVITYVIFDKLESFMSKQMDDMLWTGQYRGYPGIRQGLPWAVYAQRLAALRITVRRRRRISDVCRRFFG